MTDAVDRAFEHKAGHRSLHGNDRDRRIGCRCRIGPAHDGQKIGALAIPAGGRGHPFLAAVDQPVVALAPRGGADALAGWRRGGVGAAARLARAEGGERGAAGLQERRKQPLALLRRAAELQRQQAEHAAEHREGHAGVHAVEFLGEDRHVDHAGIVAARRRRNAFAQIAGRHHRLVGRLGREKALLGRRQLFGGPGIGQHLPGKLTGGELQLALLCREREIDRHANALRVGGSDYGYRGVVRKSWTAVPDFLARSEPVSSRLSARRRGGTRAGRGHCGA